MFPSLQQAMQQQGWQAKIVSISRLAEIQQNIEDLKSSGELSGFQQFIVNDIYSLALPEVDFPIRSILMAATPSAAKAIVTFNRGGQRIPLTLPATYIDMNSGPARVEAFLQKYLSEKGSHAVRAPKLPHKMLSVRSGLSTYGRNNITYVEGMGSFFSLVMFFTDWPAEAEEWRTLQRMPACENCQACVNNCPTGALSKERNLLYADRCLTNMNESIHSGPFPDWVPISAHNSICGCGRCQWICPMNRPYVDQVVKPMEFTEEETCLLIEGRVPGALPASLMEKLHSIEMDNYLDALPRNLKVLFAQIGVE